MTTSKRDDEMPLCDPRFDTAWRAASSEEPPAALDAAILAAARREAGAGPQPVAAHVTKPVRRQWWPLAAAATIGAIAAGLLQVVPHDELVAPGVESTVVTDMPAAPATSVPQPAAPPMPVDARKDTAPAAAGAARPAPPAQVARKTAPAASTNAQQDAGATPPTVATVPEPFPAEAPKREPAPAIGSSKPEAAAVAKLASEPAPAAPPASGGAARSANESEFARPAPQARIAAAAPRAEAAADVRANDRAPLPVAEWIALIRRLRAEGKTDEAARELTAFRLAHADHELLLPADLRAWRPAEK